MGFERTAFRVRERDGAERETTLYLWYPSPRPYGPVADGAHPLVLFSHGYLGAGDQSLFLTEALARGGYVVAALDHRDAIRGAGPRVLPNVLSPEAWSERDFRDRADDLRALLDRLLERGRTRGDRLAGRIDAGAIGAVGHSLGGYTLLGIAGAWPAWRDARVRAVALLSPYAAPFLARQKLALGIPVLLQGGTLDVGISPLLPALYERLAAPRYLLMLRDETHLGWTDHVCAERSARECASSGNPLRIVEYTRAFLDRHLRRRPAPRLDARDPGLASWRSDPG
jgi:predicted dienelactone hydrolase